MNGTGNSLPVNTTSILQCTLTVWSTMNLGLGATDCALSLPFIPWALWVLLNTSRTVLETDLFILNVLLADVACIMINLISYLNYFAFANSFQKLLVGLYCIFLNGYPLYQCSVCFEQYLAVVHPFAFLKYKPLRYKAVCLFFMWLIALVSAIFDGTVWNDFRVLLSVIIPVVCSQTYLSVSILKVLKRNTPGDRMINQERDGERSNTIKKRALVVICILEMKLLANYLPFIMISFFKGFFQLEFYECNVSPLALSVCLFGHFIHPILYLQKSGRLPVP